MNAAISQIKTVKDLVKALKNKPEDESYLRIMQSIDIPENEFEKFFTWNSEHYTRNSLIHTDDFELLLVCWEKGQSSVIHDFASNAAWTHVIRGALRENKYKHGSHGLEKVSSVSLGTSDFSFMNHPINIHRYSNCYEARTVSLHLYAKPITKWTVYNEDTGASEEQQVAYDSVYHFDSEGNIIHS